MILKGSQRSGAKQLAAHLLNERDNDHVEVHSVEGFLANDVAGALQEMYAVSRATKCRQFMFSLSLSPPKDEIVTIQDFENAIDQAMDRTGLAGQPRIVLFHEKNGRRHCHVVVSRIDLEQIKAINLPFFKTRLTELSRELYLSHGWDLPKGFADKSLVDPANFGLIEWQAAKRAKRDPREIKTTLKQCWAQSDSATSFQAVLKEKGFWLCRGTRRGFTALDYRGNAYSLTRWLDLRSTDLRARLGNPEACRSITDAEIAIQSTINTSATRVLRQIDRDYEKALQPIIASRKHMISTHRAERRAILERQQQRLQIEAIAQSRRFRTGLKGIWDWVIGTHRRNIRQMEAAYAELRHQHTMELQRLRERHLTQRRTLQDKLELQYHRVARARDIAIRTMPIIISQAGTFRELGYDISPMREDNELSYD